MRLGEQTSPAVAAAPGCVLLLPVGSCEQHGPHLPLDTDTRIAVAVAEAVASTRHDAIVAPAIGIGASGEHQAFAGTLSLGSDVLTGALVEIARSAFPVATDTTFAALVLVNGHGGNLPAVRAAVERSVAEGRPVSAWSARIPDADPHAGRTETSLLLAIAPTLVGPARPVGDTRPLAETLPDLRRGGVSAVSPNGVLGDARRATAEEGHELLRALVADLGRHLDGLPAARESGHIDS